jgi:nicotinate dehydrogenase subunit A
MPTYNFRVNGFPRSVDSADPEKPLLYVLRGLGLTATKFGCGLGQCGACTVLIDGKAARSCQMTIANAQGKTVTTLEGLGTTSAPHPVQAEKQKPSEADIRTALDGNLCRCGTHVRVVRAVLAASGQRG